MIVFEKLRFQNVFIQTKRRSQFPPVRRAFSPVKLRFRDRLVWTVGPNVETNKAAFSNCLSVVCERSLR